MQLSDVKALEAQVKEEPKSNEFYQEALSKLWTAYTSLTEEISDKRTSSKSEGLRRFIMVEEKDRHVGYLIDFTIDKKTTPVKDIAPPPTVIENPPAKEETSLLNIIKNENFEFYKDYQGVSKVDILKQETPKKLLAWVNVNNKDLPLVSDSQDTNGDWFPASTIKFVAAYYFIKSIFDINPNINFSNLQFRFTFPNGNSRIYSLEYLLENALVKSTNIEYNLLVCGITQNYYSELLNSGICMNRGYLKADWRSLTGNQRNQFKISKLEYTNNGTSFSDIYSSEKAFTNQNISARRATTANMKQLGIVIKELVTTEFSGQKKLCVDLIKNKMSRYPKGARGDQFISSLKETFNLNGWSYYYKSGYAGDRGDMWYSMCIFGTNGIKDFTVVGAVSFGSETPGENNIKLASSKLPKDNALNYERIGLNTLGKSIGKILLKELGAAE
jgi:hypothetical protein